MLHSHVVLSHFFSFNFHSHVFFNPIFFVYLGLTLRSSQRSACLFTAHSKEPVEGLHAFQGYQSWSYFLTFIWLIPFLWISCFDVHYISKKFSIIVWKRAHKACLYRLICYNSLRFHFTSTSYSSVFELLCFHLQVFLEVSSSGKTLRWANSQSNSKCLLFLYCVKSKPINVLTTLITLNFLIIIKYTFFSHIHNTLSLLALT